MNLIEILQELNIPTAPSGHRHVTQGWIGIDCPWCEDQEEYHLGINLNGLYCSCWQCGHHTLGEVLAQSSGKALWRVLDVLRDLETPEREIQALRPNYGGSLAIPKGIGPLLPAHKQYLEGRGFNPDELAKLWDIKGIGNAVKCPWSIFIPIHHEGEIVSWTTRKIHDNGNRYRTASKTEEKMSHKGVLYGEDYVRHAIIVVEGPTDVWRVGPGSVATFGLGFSRIQMFRMSKYPVRVIAFDTEREAQERAEKLCKELSCYPGKTYRVELDSDDPGSATKKEILKLRRRFLE